MRFRLKEDLQDKFLYHACNHIYNDKNPLENFGEGFHFCTNLEDLKESMPKLRDKSIIVRYKIENRLYPLQVFGDMDAGWFGFDIAELLLANHEGREVDPSYSGDNPKIISSISLSDDDIKILKLIKKNEDEDSEDDFLKAFEILYKHGYNSIEYDYIEGAVRSICLDDLNYIDLSSAVKVFDKNEVQNI